MLEVQLTSNVQTIAFPSTPQSSIPLTLQGADSCPEDSPACICYSGISPWPSLHPSNRCPQDFIYHCFSKNTYAMSYGTQHSFTKSQKTMHFQLTLAGMIDHGGTPLTPLNTFNIDGSEKKAIKISFVGCPGSKASLNGDIEEILNFSVDESQYTRVSAIDTSSTDYIFQGADSFYISFKDLDNLRILKKACLCYASTVPDKVQIFPELKCPESHGQLCLLGNPGIYGPDISTERGKNIRIYREKSFVEIHQRVDGTFLESSTGGLEMSPIKFFECYRLGSQTPERCIRLSVIGDDPKIFVSGLVKGNITIKE